MKLLEAEPTVAPEVAPEAPREIPPEQPPSLPEAVPTCKACGAPMEPEQDWCLTCGTAAPGRLGQRPGLRAVSTIGALTVALVLGAVGAGYAALHDNGNKPAQQASAPAATPAAPQQAAPTPPATQTPAPTQSTPTQSTPTQSTPSTSTPKSGTLPKVNTPSTSPSQGTPITPLPPTTPSTSTPSTSAPSTSTPSTSTPSTSTPSTSTPSTSTPTTSTPTQTTPTGPQPIDVKSDAGTVYDPYGRAKATGQTPRALDGDASTSWYVDPKNPQEIGVGYAVNLGKLQGIREVDLDTTTPGFKIEVYATDEPQAPPDILDTRWSHITNVSKVGVKGDGKEKIVLGAGTTKYRNLLLWFTTPPTDGSRLRIVDLKILG